MEMLSGGFYKGTIHRVVQPPADQRGFPRLGAFYFALADDAVRLVPLTQSPVLQRVGIVRKCPDEDAPTTREWRVARAKGRMLGDGGSTIALSTSAIRLRIPEDEYNRRTGLRMSAIVAFDSVVSVKDAMKFPRA